MKQPPMQILFRAAALSACVLALSACSSVKTSVDSGAIKANTFSFVNTTSGAGSGNNAAIHALVQNAIVQALASKGVRQAASGGDVTVAYLVIVGNNVSTTSLNDYYGYGPDAAELVEKIHKAETISSDRRDFFQEGTLFIDLVDPHTNKLLWRNSVQRDILKNPTAEAQATRLQEAVDSALSTARISH